MFTDNADEQKIDANGISLAVQTFGERQKPCVLLIMGLGVSMLGWPDELCQRIAEAGYFVVRFDNRDSGRSTWFSDQPSPNLVVATLKSQLRLPVKAPYRLDDMAQDAVALLTQLGVAEAHIVGASMGGMIAQLLTANHPQRALSLTSIMSSSGARGLPGPSLAIIRQVSTRPPADMAGRLEHSIKTYRMIGSPKFPIPDAQLRQRVTQMYQRGVYFDGTKRQALAITESGDRTTYLQTITRPTLIIHGDQDPLVPLACGVDSAKKIANSRLEIIAGMGHSLPQLLVPRLCDLMVEHFNTAADNS